MAEEIRPKRIESTRLGMSPPRNTVVMASLRNVRPTGKASYGVHQLTLAKRRVLQSELLSHHTAKCPKVAEQEPAM
jgi:hypothetical protein